MAGPLLKFPIGQSQECRRNWQRQRWTKLHMYTKYINENDWVVGQNGGQTKENYEKLGANGVWEKHN